MCIDLFNSLLTIDNIDEIASRVNSIDDGNEICELFDLVLTEIVNCLDEYKQKEKNHLKDFFSHVSEYEVNETYLVKCGWILAALSDELYERIINNINQQINKFVIQESKISKDILKFYLNCIKGLNPDNLNAIVNKNKINKINNVCSKFNNTDNIIQSYIDAIDTMISFKTLYEFKFKENYDNEDKKLIKIKFKIKKNLKEVINIAKDIGIEMGKEVGGNILANVLTSGNDTGGNTFASALTSGKESARLAAINNMPQIVDKTIQIGQNSWEFIKEQCNNDKKNRIILIEDMIEYANLIKDALNDAGEIIDEIEQNSKVLKKLKRNGKTKLKNLELLIPNFDFNKKNDIKILKESTDIIKEILDKLI